MKKLLITYLTLLFLFFPLDLFASEPKEKSEQGIFTLEVMDSLITLNAKNASLRMILQTLEIKSGIKVKIHEDVEDKKVSLDIMALPTYAVGKLLEKMKIENFALFYDKDLDSEVIYIVPQGMNIGESLKGKTIIRPAIFLSGKSVNQIKGNEILTDTKNPNKIPIRYVKGELILKFHRGVSSKEIDTLLRKYNLERIDKEVLSKIGYVKVRIPDGREVFEVKKEITKEYKLKAAEPNYISDIMAITDPLYKNQWYVSSINFDKAWVKLINRNRVKVAVIDTGVDREHPDLLGRVLGGYNFVNENLDATDKHGHGTFVAGIIAANSNTLGIKGLYDFADIIPVKVMNDNGVGTYEDVARGIIYAVDNGARVINLSIGGYAFSFLLQDAVDYALENGCILVASGGNDGVRQAVYPAAYPDVIGVSALGLDGNILPLSNSGKHIDVTAPGDNIISTGLNGQYIYTTGTSASTPMVSALTAMLLIERADLSSSAIQRLILQSAKDLGTMGRDKIYGTGKIDGESALEQVGKPFHDVAVRSVGVGPRIFEKGMTTFIIANLSNSGTYKEEVCDVVVREIIGEEKKVIGRKKEVTVYDKLQVSFEWKPDALKENIKFEVQVFMKNDSNNSNNLKPTNTFLLQESNNLYILHKTDPPVHQWVAYQAKFIWSNSEINSYLPTTWSNSTSILDNSRILYGARMEDDDNASDACYPLTSCSPCLGWSWDSGYTGYHPYCNHFWDPDGGADEGLYYFDKQWQSAYRRAQYLWDDKVIPYYSSGSKTNAYYWLGRVAHLLTDMAVPAHVNSLSSAYGDLDIHPISDSYENYIGNNFSNWSASGSPINKSSLYNLFLDMAEMSDNFDSDDVDGEVDKGVRNSCFLGWCTIDDANCTIIGNTLMPEAMRHIAGLYQLFWNSTHPDLTASATVGSNYTSGQTGVQIPVTVYRSGTNLTKGTYVHVKLYWSSNSTWDSGDTVLWQSNDSIPDFPISTLNSSGSKTVMATINIPNVSAGTYYIIAYADAPATSYPNGYHDEINENNNTAPYSVTVTTQADRTLTVASSNPSSGVSIAVSPNDNNGQGNGTTQFTRAYNNNTLVYLTAPSTAGGNNFLKWQRNGVDYSTAQSTNVTMDANYTMTAVYLTSAGILKFSSATFSVNEGGGFISIAVTRTGGSSGAVGVNYATSDGTAKAGSDYAAKSGTLSWTNGDTANKTFSVSIINDTLVEPSKTFSVTLSSPTGGATLGSPSSTTVTINDNDNAGTIQFSSSTFSVNEGGGFISIAVTRTGGSSGAVGVNYAASDGTAKAGSDYAAKSGTLSWTNGDTANKTFSVPITNDTLDEPSEWFTVMLSNPTGGATLGSPSSATVTITDNDPTPTVQFSAASSSGSEATTPALITVNLSAASGQTVTVKYVTANGTAMAGSDYMATSGTLTFNPGVTSRTISVPIINDTVVEGNETFTVTLSDPVNATLGTITTHTYTIQSDDKPSVTVTATDSTATENPLTTGYFTVSRTGSTSGPLTVYYDVSGTGTAGSDYNSLSGSVTIPVGSSTARITLTPINDLWVESNEKVTVTLRANAAYTIGSPGSATVTIISEDAVSIGIFTNGFWALDMNGNGQWDGETIDKVIGFGEAGYIPVTGDWNGTGRTKIGLYKDGLWFLDVNGNGQWDGESIDRVIGFLGIPGEIPVTGDWNGDGKTEIGIYLNGLWALDMNGNGQWDGETIDKVIGFGEVGYKPVTGRW